MVSFFLSPSWSVWWPRAVLTCQRIMICVYRSFTYIHYLALLNGKVYPNFPEHFAISLGSKPFEIGRQRCPRGGVHRLRFQSEPKRSGVSAKSSRPPLFG